MRCWDLPATRATVILRLEVLTEIPEGMRTKSEERALVDLARWLAEHAEPGSKHTG